MFYRPLLPRVLLTAYLFSLPTQAAWAEQAPKTAITAAQRQQIHGIGQALLTARRQAKPSAQAIAIRQQLKQVKAQLDSLTAPLPVGKIMLKPASTSTPAKTVEKTASQQQSWKQRHEKRIEKLNASLVQLNEMTDEVSLQRTPPVEIKQAPKPLNLWQQFKSRALKQPAVSSPQNEGADTAEPILVHTDLSEIALNQLNTLQAEINEAMIQPNDQRQLALRALSMRLTLSKSPSVTQSQSNEPANNSGGDDNSAVKTPTRTPTITSRTTHRREF